MLNSDVDLDLIVCHVENGTKKAVQWRANCLNI